MPTGVYVRTDKHREALKKSGTSRNYNKTRVGKLNHNWKNDPKYQAVHIWLRSTYGHATCCENNGLLGFDCREKSKAFVWGLIPGKTYVRERSNFMQMCQSCNIRCEVNDEFKRKSLLGPINRMKNK